MLKTLLKVLCEGALWWLSAPLQGFPVPGGGEGDSASEPLWELRALEQHCQQLRLWRKAESGGSTASRALSCRVFSPQAHQQLTPPVADANKAKPPWWSWAAHWISCGPGVMFRRKQQMGVCLIKVDGHNGTACNSIRRLSLTGQCCRLGADPAKVWPLYQPCQARSQYLLLNAQHLMLIGKRKQLFPSSSPSPSPSACCSMQTLIIEKSRLGFI